MLIKNALLLFIMLFAQALFSSQPYFLFDPCLSPDGNTLVFAHNGDLWSVKTDGGIASRLTAMEGLESRPSYSPDGKWIAFSSTIYGNEDVFIMPSSGGSVEQLTFHTGSDQVQSWSWDSKNIYFVSNRYNRYTGFKIEVTGGTPSRLFDHYFNTVHNIVEHPDQSIYFNESWESNQFASRKRYKGDYNPDVKKYSSKTGKFEVLTTSRGKDFGVTIDTKGAVYFMSDEGGTEFNLFTFSGAKTKQLTTFPTSIYWPKVSANGNKIAFRKDYQIFIYDVKSGKTSQPDIQIITSEDLAKKDDFNSKGKIQSADVSLDKKKIAFTSRGRLFVSDIKGKFIRAIATDPTEAVNEVKWLKDNTTILYSQTVKGYYQWFCMAADKPSSPKQITFGNTNNRQLSFNSDRSLAIYLSGRNELNLLNLDSLTVKNLAKAELWGHNQTTPVFSPDDRYVAFTAINNFEEDVLIYDFESQKTENLTHTMVSESDPFWSPDGKFLYITTDPIHPRYPYGSGENKVFRVSLNKAEKPFVQKEWDKLFETERKDTTSAKKEAKVEKVKVIIDPGKIMERMESISPSFGQQSQSYVISDKTKSHVYYVSNHAEGKNFLWRTTFEDFEEPKTEKISTKPVSSYSMIKADDKYYILFGGSLHSMDGSTGKMEEIELSVAFEKGLSEEFEQMFHEAWAGFEENYYDENFHGQDWQALRKRYAAFLPSITNRNDLRILFNDMLGELNTSHVGFRSTGTEETVFNNYTTWETGIVWKNDAPYIVERWVTDSPGDHGGQKVMKGDKLTKVNGVIVDQSKNREQYFASSAKFAEVRLTFERAGEAFTVDLHTISPTELTTLLYDEWQDRNQTMVDAKSKNTIGYVHMKDMSRGELTAFQKDLISDGAYKKGLIVDLRYNVGGNVHDEVLQMLSKKRYLNWKYREGEKTSQPNFTFGDRPIVMLINEQSLSDAEMTSQGFKQLGLGTLVGTETYRWIIFTSGRGLVDGSFYRLPSWGCYTLDGKDMEMSGVAPDVRVEMNFKDRIDGKDPQLDKALEILGIK